MGSCGRSFKGFLGAMPGDQGQNQRIRDAFVALVWSLLRFHARGDVRSCIENRCPKFGPNPARPPMTSRVARGQPSISHAALKAINTRA
jgi:hypothetical protein